MKMGFRFQTDRAKATVVTLVLQFYLGASFMNHLLFE
jgi:hypothetical protein